MDTNKVSNLFRYLKNKYGEEYVTLLINWEFTVKKMADYRKHRRFTLRCIKASLTPVSCKLRNPLKTNKSYSIIHKAEKQLLYERIRNINSILDMYQHNRCKQYSFLKNMINENEINTCLHLINRLKEHRHDKIKARQIDKFECLYFKQYGYGYNHNFSRGSENLDNINTANVTLSGHSHLPPSSFSTRSHASGNSSTPAAPILQHLQLPHPWHSQHPQWHPATTTVDPDIHASILTTINKSGSSTYIQYPPYISTRISIGKRPKFCHSPKVPPKSHTSQP